LSTKFIFGAMVTSGDLNIIDIKKVNIGIAV